MSIKKYALSVMFFTFLFPSIYANASIFDGQCANAGGTVYFGDGAVPDGINDGASATLLIFNASGGEVFRIANTTNNQNIRDTAEKSLLLNIPIYLCVNRNTSPYTVISIYIAR